MNSLLTFFSAFIVTLCLIPLVIRFSYNKGILDYPKANSVHTMPTPMMAGPLIFLVFFLMGLKLKNISAIAPFFLSSLILVISGIYDDLKGLNALHKLSIQFIAAAILVVFGVTITRLNVPFAHSVNLAVLTPFITIIWFIFMINLINIMDGLDGLAPGLCLIVFYILYVMVGQGDVGFQLLVLTGIMSAVLIFNFHPARIFLGNSGSSFLGLAVGYFSLITSQKSRILPILLVPIIILLVQVFDMLYAIIRRSYKGADIFKGDKGHIHHLMLNFTNDQRLTVLSFYLVSAVFALLALRVFAY